MPAHVVIAGAGIGGLTLAVALRCRGVPVTVLERQPDLQAAGAGLGLQPNAILCLDWLGLGRAVRDAGSEIESTAILDSTGRPLGAAVDVKELAQGLGAPVVALHRARLHETLLDAAGSEAIRTGVSVMRYESSADGVVVSCNNGERIAASLLVGADGLRSAVRAQMVGDGEPIYAGYTSWRGVTPAGAVPPPRRMSESWGRGERFGMVDIGFEQIYWFAVADAPSGGTDGDVRRELLARFGGWHEPIRSVIDATPAAQILRTDICDRPPIKRWHDRRVVLLGDAAHPMTPNLGQGAGQAIEDAVVLDRCLSETSSIETAFREYETQRVARANGILRASRALGTLAQWQNPAAVWFRNTALRLTPASFALAQARKMLKGTSV